MIYRIPVAPHAESRHQPMPLDLFLMRHQLPLIRCTFYCSPMLSSLDILVHTKVEICS